MKYVSIPKYRKRPRSEYVPDYGDDLLHLPTVAVYEDDDPQETGLIDKRGHSIFRVHERGKIGF